MTRKKTKRQKHHTTKNTDLSASSSTKISIVLRSKLGAFNKWSINRPGVAITMSGPRRNAASCDFTSRPPDRRKSDKIKRRLLQSRILRELLGLPSDYGKEDSLHIYEFEFSLHNLETNPDPPSHPRKSSSKNSNPTEQLYNQKTKCQNEMKSLTSAQTYLDTRELRQLSGHRVDLDSQFPGGHQDQHPGHTGLALGLE